jgi:hypothetical protein
LPEQVVESVSFVASVEEAKVIRHCPKVTVEVAVGTLLRVKVDEAVIWVTLFTVVEVAAVWSSVPATKLVTVSLATKVGEAA